MPERTTTIKDLVKDGNQAIFNYYRNGVFYYEVIYGSQSWLFPIPITDIQGVSLNRLEKAITLMRWIRKAMASGELIKID